MLERSTIIKALELAGLKKGDIFYDLGCGNGQVLIEAAKMGAKAVGFEISPYYYLWAKFRTSRNPNIEVHFINIKDVDLSRADIVYCYLLPNFLEKLGPKFKQELKPSAKLISVGFQIRGLKMVKKLIIKKHIVFVYRTIL